jgi:RHS repeat-associated protein
VNGTHRSEFSYDAFGHRVGIVEKDNGTTTSNKKYLWVGEKIAEERDSTGATTNKRFFGGGFKEGSSTYFYTEDHLGSIREVVDTTGAVRARYDYDPYGRRTKVSGDVEADFGYTGHFEHVASGLKLALYRAYDPSTGRWISRDPLGTAGGLNLYGYVGGDPINNVDPLGLQAAGTCGPEIAPQLGAMLNRLGNDFKSWTSAQQGAACQNIDPSLKDALLNSKAADAFNAWDVPCLKAGRNDMYSGMQCKPTGDRTCQQTVSVEGQCFAAGDVNYVVYGRMMSLCGRSLQNAIDGATFYRGSMGKSLGPDLVPWVQAGYQGWPNSSMPTATSRGSTCSSKGFCGAPCTFDYKWVGSPHPVNMSCSCGK